MLGGIHSRSSGTLQESWTPAVRAAIADLANQWAGEEDVFDIPPSPQLLALEPAVSAALDVAPVSNGTKQRTSTAKKPAEAPQVRLSVGAAPHLRDATNKDRWCPV